MNSSYDLVFDIIVDENWLIVEGLTVLFGTLSSAGSTMRLKCHTVVPLHIISPGMEVGSSSSGWNDLVNR